MLGSAKAAGAVAEAAEDKTDKVKEFDRWSDDETPEANEANDPKREFDAWSDASEEPEPVEHVEPVEPEPVDLEAEAPEADFFMDAEPDFSLVDVGVSSKHSAPHPGEAPVEVPKPRLAPKPPKAPPPSHLLRAAQRPIPPPLRTAPTVPVPMHMGPIRSVRPMVQPVPVMLVPVSLSAAWSCFFSLQHGTERMKLFATVVLGDPRPAQALIQEANANLRLRHRSHFDDVKKAALKVVLQLVPMTDQKDQQARDRLETYLLSKDRAGVVRVGNRDLYLIPPTKVEECGLKVRPPAKSLVAAVAEKQRKKAKQTQSQAEAKKKAAEVLVADDTEDSEEAKDDKKEERNDDKTEEKKDDKTEENNDAKKDGDGDAAPEVQDEKKEDEKKEDEKKEGLISDREVLEGEEEKSKQSQAASEEVDEDLPEKKEEKATTREVPQVRPPTQAKPRFSRQDVEEAAFELARSRDRPARAPRAPAPYHEPWWNPYACPPGKFVQPEPAPERRRKRRRSSKERRRTRRRSKSQDSSSSSVQASSGPPEATAARPFQNPYVDPAPIETSEAQQEEGTSTDEKWKGLLARVEALAQFCRDGNDAPGLA